MHPIVFCPVCGSVLDHLLLCPLVHKEQGLMPITSESLEFLHASTTRGMPHANKADV